jgi:hypothetical protein
LGGEVYVDKDTGDDRHTVSLLFPMDEVVDKFETNDKWEQYLNEILVPFEDLK